ncbi:Potassium-transporting ATPase alpha chain 2 [Balamuthia mandrillaris]
MSNVNRRKSVGDTLDGGSKDKLGGGGGSAVGSPSPSPANGSGIKKVGVMFRGSTGSLRGPMVKAHDEPPTKKASTLRVKSNPQEIDKLGTNGPSQSSMELGESSSDEDDQSGVPLRFGGRSASTPNTKGSVGKSVTISTKNAVQSQIEKEIEEGREKERKAQVEREREKIRKEKRKSLSMLKDRMRAQRKGEADPSDETGGDGSESPSPSASAASSSTIVQVSGQKRGSIGGVTIGGSGSKPGSKAGSKPGSNIKETEAQKTERETKAAAKEAERREAMEKRLQQEAEEMRKKEEREEAERKKAEDLKKAEEAKRQAAAEEKARKAAAAEEAARKEKEDKERKEREKEKEKQKEKEEKKKEKQKQKAKNEDDEWDLGSDEEKEKNAGKRDKGKQKDGRPPSGGGGGAGELQALGELYEDGTEVSENFDIHLIGVPAAVKRMRTDVINGLSEEEVLRRREHHGENVIPCQQLDDDYVHLPDEIVRVRRDGKSVSVPSRELVIGDIVELKKGERIVADMLVIKSMYMMVDNSLITGDPEPQYRSINHTTEIALETANLLFYGTEVTAGEGLGLVYSIGGKTILGRMLLYNEESQARKDSKLSGPRAKKNILKMLQKKGIQCKDERAAARLGKVTALVVDMGGVITENKLTYLLMDGQIFNTAEKIPDESRSFPIVMQTAVLSTNAYFSKPSTPRVVTGKTRKDRVEKLFHADNMEVVEYDLTSGALLRFYEKYPPKKRDKPRESSLYSEMERELYQKVAEDESDIRVSVHRVPAAECEEHEKPEAELTPEEKKKKEVRGRQTFVVCMYGPFNVILQHCTSILYKGERFKLDSAAADNLKAKANELFAYGERSVALAWLPLYEDKFPEDYEFDSFSMNFPVKEMCFVALVSTAPRPMPNIHRIISKCREAKLRIVMVSSEGPAAVSLLGKKVGLLTHDTVYDIAEKEGCRVDELTRKQVESARSVVIDGLSLIATEQLTKICQSYDEVVIANTDPTQKIKVVHAIQKVSDSEVVACTGFLPNDMPSLAQSDVGLAMAGSMEAVQQAADVVLGEGSLETILEAVELVKKKSGGGGCMVQ